MAINTAPTFTPGQRLSPEQLAQMMALSKNDQRSGSMPGKFGPQITFEANQVQRGTSVGADAEYMPDPSGSGRYLISQPRNVSNMGGNDVTDVWDQDGNYLGTSSGMTDLRGLATITAMALGGAYANGGFGAGTAGGAGGTAGAAGMTASEQASMMAANGMTDMQIAQALGGQVGADLTTATGMSAAANGVSNTTNLGDWWDKAKTFAQSLGNGNSSAAASTGSNSMNWLDVINTAAGIYGMAQAGQNSSDATAAMENVANGQMALNQEALNWYKQVYADQAPARDAAAQRANAISDSLLTGMNFANTQAQELDQYNKATFRPIEQRMVADATDYNTAERRETAANDATGQVATSYDIQRQQAQRDMERAGVDPSTIYALGVSSRLDEAKAQAGAANTARTGVEQQGWSRMADVANMGRGIASQQSTQQQIATTTGNSSTANAIQGLNATQSGNNLMSQGFQNATQGNQVTGNLFNQVANAQRQDDQMLINGVGGITNYMGNRYGTSDPKVKKGTGRMANTAQALKEVEATPVHDGWEYDESKGAPPGSGGKKMTGPMATDVQRISGEASAPGGKQIDLVKQQGRMMAAIQKLAKDVRALKKHETEPETEEA